MGLARVPCGVAILPVPRMVPRRGNVEDLLRFSNRNGGWSAVPVLTTVYEVPRRVGLGACGVSVWERVVELVGIIRLFLRVDSEPCSVFELHVRYATL